MSADGRAKVPGLLVVGIGNDDRSDDAVGLVIARSLAGKNLPDVTVVEAQGDGTMLEEAWKGADNVIVVDAICSGAPPGTIHRIEAHVEPVPTGVWRCSSHSFGLAEAIEMARTLNRLPARITVLGIEARNLDMGIGLSREVVSAARQVVAAITQEVKARPHRPRRTRSRARSQAQVAE